MRRLITLIVVGVFVAACGGSAGNVAADQAADPPTAGAAPASPATAGDDATPPDGSSDRAPFGLVETVGGETVDGEDYAGRDLALWFWAPW